MNIFIPRKYFLTTIWQILSNYLVNIFKMVVKLILLKLQFNKKEKLEKLETKPLKLV